MRGPPKRCVAAYRRPGLFYPAAGGEGVEDVIQVGWALFTGRGGG